MRPIINAIDEIIFKIYKNKHPILGDLIMHWRDIVGLELSTGSTPIKITSNVINGKKTNNLYISVENSSISLELAYKQDIIIERISVYLGYKAIHKIKLLIRE